MPLANWLSTLSVLHSPRSQNTCSHLQTWPAFQAGISVSLSGQVLVRRACWPKRIMQSSVSHVSTETLMTSALISFSGRPCQRPLLTTGFLPNCCVFLYFPLTKPILIVSPSSELTSRFSLHRGWDPEPTPVGAFWHFRWEVELYHRLTSSFWKNLPK